MSDKIKSHYEGYDEAARLHRGKAHSIEFLTTVNYFDKTLPQNSRVLDVCAGCGDYAFHLADRGHEVIACDLVDRHVEAMRANPNAGKLAGIETANALDLSRFEANSFDVVLCMGALYHLFEQQDREKCVRECLRVLKPGGIFAFAYLNRAATAIAEFCRGRNAVPMMEVLRTGKIYVFYSMAFGEAQALADKFDMEKIADVGVDGLCYPLAQRLNETTDEEFDEYMEYYLATCEEPSMLGHSAHGLWLGSGRQNSAPMGVVVG